MVIWLIRSIDLFDFLLVLFINLRYRFCDCFIRRFFDWLIDWLIDDIIHLLVLIINLIYWYDSESNHHFMIDLISWMIRWFIWFIHSPFIRSFNILGSIIPIGTSVLFDFDLILTDGDWRVSVEWVSQSLEKGDYHCK